MYVPWLFDCLFRGIEKNVNVDTVDVVLRLRCCAMVDIQSAQAQKHVKRVGRRRISLINAGFEGKKSVRNQFSLVLLNFCAVHSVETWMTNDSVIALVS
jgi:hypothetical protein